MASAFAPPPLTFTRIFRTQKLTLPTPPAKSAESAACCWKKHLRAPRRLFLGLGAASLIDRMASGSGSGSGGGRPFTASARPLVSPVEQILKNVEWPEKFPFKEEDFARFDESPDTLFYSDPRFVMHIDDYAIAALTKYYSKVFPPSNTPGVSLLDMCSSWVSHYPPGYRQDRIVGMGLNEDELKQNPVSVDYLTKPFDVFKEMQRILKPGGLALISFSNRMFWTKAISIWTSTGDADHAWIMGLTSIMLEVLNQLRLWTYHPTLGARIQYTWCILERTQLCMS